MPLFDEEATAKLNALIDVTALNSKNIAQMGERIDKVGERIDKMADKVDKLADIVFKTWDRQEKLIDESIRHREDPTAHQE